MRMTNKEKVKRTFKITQDMLMETHTSNGSMQTKNIDKNLL